MKRKNLKGWPSTIMTFESWNMFIAYFMYLLKCKVLSLNLVSVSRFVVINKSCLLIKNRSTLSLLKMSWLKCIEEMCDVHRHVALIKISSLSYLVLQWISGFQCCSFKVSFILDLMVIDIPLNRMAERTYFKKEISVTNSSIYDLQYLVPLEVPQKVKTEWKLFLTI